MLQCTILTNIKSDQCWMAGNLSHGIFLLQNISQRDNCLDLLHASQLADWLISTSQRQKDGAYINHQKVYTSVIYIAKSMLELSIAEQEIAEENTFWQNAAKRHYSSAKRAIDQLVAQQGNLETEGEETFEDGMLSCSALQIGMLALMQKDERDRQHYTNAMLQLLQSHDCLTQLRVPDARRRGGTMRYWETQYDVQMLPNMILFARSRTTLKGTICPVGALGLAKKMAPGFVLHNSSTGRV